MILGEPLQVTILLAEVFERLNIRYLIGGSLASSIHGIPRATQDVDLVAEIVPSQVEPFVEALQATFYIDADMIKDALRRESAFNIIHLETMFKVDIFPLKKNAEAQEEMERRESYTLPDQTKGLYVASAEDMVLEKLRWYRLGNQISDRQWQDVQGILKVKQEQLDLHYMNKKAHGMGLEELLNRALQDAS